MNKLKISLLVGAILLIAIVFPTRYLAPEAGIITTTDYGSHLNISSHIRDLDLFPSLTSTDVGRHSVSKYLPIYHGLIGFHLAAATLETIGIPLPGAYALLMDLSLLSVLLVFAFIAIDKRKENIWGIGFAILLIPLFYGYFVQAVISGFLSQIISQALIVVAGYLLSQKWKKTSWGLIAFAMFCYPDFVIWLIPAIVIDNKYDWKLKVPLTLLFSILALTPFTRATLAGPQITSPFIYLATLLVVFTVLPTLWKKNRAIATMSASFVIYSATLTLLTMKHFNPSYYATKITSFSYLLLPYLLATNSLIEHLRNRIALVVIAFLVVAAYSDLANVDIAPFTKPPHAFNNYQYQTARAVNIEVRDSVKSCSPFLTYKTASLGENLTAVNAFNGVLRNYDIYSIEANPYLNLIQQLKDKSPEVLISELENELKNHRMSPDFCLAVPRNDMSFFAKSQYFEKLYEGAQFVYFKPQKP